MLVSTNSVVTIPNGYPGYLPATARTYLQGAAATAFYSVDGASPIEKPSWLAAVEFGATSSEQLDAVSRCAAFGNSNSGNTLDVSTAFRVSEKDCDSIAQGTGTLSDPVFVRIILNRADPNFGTGENLLVTLDYEATGLATGSDTDPDQLWKWFGFTDLAQSTSGAPIATAIPANTGVTGKVNRIQKQILIPLSSLPDDQVFQLSRLSGLINRQSSSVSCQQNSPKCLGVVIYAITIQRI